MKTQHTTGFWQVDWRYPCLIRTPKEMIATTAPYASTGLHLAVPDEKKSRANALLIAAAPELLEACKKLVSELDANYIGTGCNDLEGSSEQALIDLVKGALEAIFKAQGQEK